MLKGDKPMMTGRDLILYILQNGLENEPVFEDGKFLGFMSVMEAAIKFDVGVATINVWYHSGMLPGIRIGDSIYIPANAERPEFAIN